jgi:hypothetical protein
LLQLLLRRRSKQLRLLQLQRLLLGRHLPAMEHQLRRNPP